MRTLTGKVLGVEIGVQIEKKDGGFYEGWRLTFRDGSGKIQDVAKPIQGLKYQPSLRTSLEALKEGDFVTIDLEKNDKGFNDVVAIGKGDEMPTQTKAAAPAPRAYKTDRSERSDDVQRMIVRQSSLAQAVNTLGLSKDPKAVYKTGDVLAIAEQYESWVMRKDPVPEAE